MATLPSLGVRLGWALTCPFSSSFLQGLQQRMLQCSLRWWHMRALGPDATSCYTKTPSAPEPMGSSTSQGSLEKVRGRWVGRGWGR